MYNRPLLAVLLAIGTVAPAAAQYPASPASPYRVESWGYYDRSPNPPVLGSRTHYSESRPIVTYYDPRRGWVQGPLQPKVLYYGGPILTPEGPYTPRSITVYANDRQPALMPVPVPPATSAPPRPEPPPSSFRYDGGPRTPIPDVAPDNEPPPAREPARPDAPPVPQPPPPAPPGPKLGPTPRDLFLTPTQR